jgi:hypothetical protein
MLMSEKQVSDLIAIIVAVMVAVMVANTAIMQRLCSEADTGLIATGSGRRRGYIEL